MENSISSAQPRITGATSDGYHTFDELYEHRHMLFSIVCAMFDGWKSKAHAKGEKAIYDGFFIAGVQTPLGQATYHLPLRWWDRYQCKELEYAPKFDGHTADDALQRIPSLCTAPAWKGGLKGSGIEGK